MKTDRVTADDIRITGALAAFGNLRLNLILPEYEGDFRAIIETCDKGSLLQRRPCSLPEMSVLISFCKR
jgi:hypothetical protein